MNQVQHTRLRRPAINGFYARGKQDQFLSNFFYFPFTLATVSTVDSPVAHLLGQSAPTVEHFFQAAKTLDTNSMLSVLRAPTAADSKRMGRRVALRPDWETVKYAAMKEILRSKFADRSLREQLLATGDADLIEANQWHDTIWGVCTCTRHQNTGQNFLGKTLMELRAEINDIASINPATT